jgi:hypothetical protein
LLSLEREVLAMLLLEEFAGRFLFASPFRDLCWAFAAKLNINKNILINIMIRFNLNVLYIVFMTLNVVYALPSPIGSQQTDKTIYLKSWRQSNIHLSACKACAKNDNMLVISCLSIMQV